MPPEPQLDLSALMQRGQTGDQAAYHAALNVIHPMVKSYVMRRIKNPQQAEELSQDVLLRIHAYRHTYDPSKKLEPWIYTIAKNTLIDFFRATGRRKDIKEVGDLDLNAMFGQDDNAEARLAVMEAFEGLSADERDALQKVKVDGLTMVEAAKETGVSVSAMKVRAHRAYKAFFNRLRE